MIKKMTDMTTKKKYVKPQITVIEVEPQQLICMSGSGAPEFGRQDADELEYIGGFE